MLWKTDLPRKRTNGESVVRLDPPLHGACVNDAPLCEHGNHMATIKRDAGSPSGLALRYWRCHCVAPLVGAELFRAIREMREAMTRRSAARQRPSRSWQGGDAA
jgi:hypothetical protein